jgi:hypothetical protein
MNTLEKLTLEAFQLALSRLEEPLPEPLVQRVQIVSENWAAQISELKSLTEQFEPLRIQYQEARLELQSQSADRKQFAENGFQSNGGNGKTTAVVRSAAPPTHHPAEEDTPPQTTVPELKTTAPNPPPLSINFTQKKILKTLEKAHLSAQELTHTVNQPAQQTQEILHRLWQKGYIDQLSTPLPYILFPGLRSPEYRNNFPPTDTLLTLTTKGYFHLYPLVSRNKRTVSA